ncbi:MAG: energy-coupling factor ABC transporter ATP-binding protein [Promethearchaeota archaeon]
MILIDFHNFYFRYKKNEEYALANINLKIKDNKFILLCGETGSGKTTLIRCMNGLIPQFYAGFYKGSVNVCGKDTVETPIADLSTDVGIVFQNPENQLISMNVEHEIAFGLENIGIPREQIAEKIKEVAKITNISHLLEKAPFELSGGEQQRVAIASILALEPKVLVLDEPTAQLDPYTAQEIIRLIKEIQQKKKITVIISEHRLDLVMSYADEIILIKDGKILEHDSKENVTYGNNFKELYINHPFIYNVFEKLRKEGLEFDKIPLTIKEAINFIKDNY